ncbi:MAG: translation elongation factor Ts [bacterium]
MSPTPQQVKDLRDKTGVGFMDCKRALEATNGDLEKAIEYLRKQGIAKAEKRMGRVTREGTIHSYIHPGSRLGVLVEVNCETDFVAKTEEFKAFAKDVCMQVAATNPLVVSREDVPKDLVEKEESIYRTQALSSGKREAIADKIVKGKMEKYYAEVCLLEQPFVKDPEKTVEALLKELIAKTGENISIKRFARFRLGE